jgi:hypothetical protein
MARFFLHLHECGSLIPDEEGMDLGGPEEARAEALRSARQIMCAEVQHGTLCLDCHIEVVSADRVSSFNVAFRDAVEITGR